MHLGHPLPACFDLRSAFDLVRAELSAQIAEFHAQPIQVLDRVLLVNTMILPRLLYRTKCLPLPPAQLINLSSVVERFVLGVTGLPPLVTKKTLYTQGHHVLGLSYFPVLHPTRALDALHRNTGLPEFSTSPPSFPLSPYALFLSAVGQLGFPRDAPTPPLPVLWRAQSTLRDAISILSVSGLTVYLLPHHSSPDATYTDGSKLGDPPSSGASAVLPGGTVAVCRVRGVPNSYKAELVGALLGSSLSLDGQRIRLDCKGAIAAVHSRRRLVRQAFRVHKVRSSVLSRGQTLEWVEGHVGMSSTRCPTPTPKSVPPCPFPPPWSHLHRGTSSAPAKKSYPPTRSGHTTSSPPTHMHISTPCLGVPSVTNGSLGTIGSLASSPGPAIATTPLSGETTSPKTPARTATHATIKVCMVCSHAVHPPTPSSRHG